MGSGDLLKRRLNHNHLRQLCADGRPRVAHLADDVRLTGEQLDDLIFAKSDFMQPMVDFGRRAELFDADSNAGLGVNAIECATSIAAMDKTVTCFHNCFTQP